MKKYIFISMLVVSAMVLSACGDKDESGDDGLTQSVEITDEEKVAEDEVVAIVNGSEITGLTYNLVYAQLKLQSQYMEEDFDLEEVKEATMNSLIDEEIVFQDAEEEGIKITKDAVQTEFNKIKKENGEDLDTLLDQYQITEEGFKESIRYELMMNEYLTKVIKVEVTDEEVQEAYDEVKAEAEEDEEIPAFEEVKNQIEANMREEKISLALEERVEEVKENAEIERKI